MAPARSAMPTHNLAWYNATALYKRYLFACASFQITFTTGVQPNSRVGSNQLFRLGITFAQNLVEDDRAEGCYPNAADREVANGDGKVDGAYTDHARTNCESNRGCYQV